MRRLPEGLFDGIAAVVDVPVEESYAANLLSNGTDVVMAAHHPVTRKAVASRGFQIRELDLSEIRKGDGALTCMSVWF